DLKIATAYVTPLGETEHAPVVDALNRHAKFIRGRLAPALRQMKYMPEIRFRDDTSFENFRKIDDLLRSPEVARDLRDDDSAED
ncbi:MAG TPA: ribosome-binding factor A, partial [Pararhizobium sp.]|nr:ribosome-binding factor A [Pararhizobium sp.]